MRRSPDEEKVESSKHFKLLVILAVIFISLTFFQNCAPSGGTGAFNLSSSNPGSTTSGSNGTGTNPTPTVTLSALSLAPNAVVQGGSTMNVTVMISAPSQASCQWFLANAAGTVVSTQAVSMAMNGMCAFTQAAPSISGSYTLSVFVTDTQGQGATDKVVFQISTPSPTPPPLPSCQASCSGFGGNFACGISGNNCADEGAGFLTVTDQGSGPWSDCSSSGQSECCCIQP